MRERESPFLTMYVSVSAATEVFVASAGFTAGAEYASPEAGILISCPILIIELRFSELIASSSETDTRCFFAIVERLSPFLTT